MAHAEWIATAIDQNIFEYRIQSFDKSGIDVRVYPVPSAFEFYDAEGTWVGFDQYVFDAFGEAPKPMFVTVDHAWNVKIKYLGAWRPVSAYLRNLKPHDPWDDLMAKSDIMHLKWRQQADWWKDNGKVFPLMQLPREIRELVYNHVWGPIIEPYPTNSARKLTAHGKLMRKLRMPNTHLLSVCRLVSEEAGNVLYARTKFGIHHYGVLQAFTMNVAQRSRARHLELALSHDEFMNLFSKEHVRKDKQPKTEVLGLGWAALALRTMKLSSLRLVIAPPSFTTKTGKFDGACQRVAVDVLLEAAWPVIRGHPLELAGFIKEDQKKMYEARDVLERKRVGAWQKRRAAWGAEGESLAEYDEELDEEVGGVPLDGKSPPETVPEELHATKYNLTCHCDPPCEEETWSPSA